jgi:hypothetical protein
MTRRSLRCGWLAVVVAATLAPGAAAGTDLLAFRGVGIKSGARTFLLGETREAGKDWQTLTVGVEFKTQSENEGTVVALRCSDPCSTENGIRTGDPADKVTAAFGQANKEAKIAAGDEKVTFLLYKGLGFELDDKKNVARIYVLPNVK